jgi:hypothetical protein
VGGYVLQQQHVDAGGGERNKNKKVVESMRRICSLIALIFLIFFSLLWRPWRVLLLCTYAANRAHWASAGIQQLKSKGK